MRAIRNEVRHLVGDRAGEQAVRLGKHSEGGKRDEERVAVWFGARDSGVASLAAAAGAVLDNHGLSQSLPERLCYRPRGEIALPARRKRNHKRDGAGRPLRRLLCTRSRTERGRRSKRESGDGLSAVHTVPSSFVPQVLLERRRLGVSGQAPFVDSLLADATILTRKVQIGARWRAGTNGRRLVEANVASPQAFSNTPQGSTNVAGVCGHASEAMALAAGDQKTSCEQNALHPDGTGHAFQREQRTSHPRWPERTHGPAHASILDPGELRRRGCRTRLSSCARASSGRGPRSLSRQRRQARASGGSLSASPRIHVLRPQRRRRTPLRLSWPQSST